MLACDLQTEVDPSSRQKVGDYTWAKLVILKRRQGTLYSVALKTSEAGEWKLVWILVADVGVRSGL